MRELINVLDYDTYVGDILNESLIHGEQRDCDDAFINSTPVITFSNGEQVRAVEIVDVVKKARHYLKAQYTRTFEFTENTLNIFYLAHSEKIKTMAIDKHMNLYMNAAFIYYDLKMNPKFVAAVIMHETFHALFNHIERSTNWLAAKGKAKTPQAWHDTNLAADVEVNRILIKIGLITEDALVNEIHGMYLSKRDGGMDVVMLEKILDNEEYMKKLRQMCPPPSDPEKNPPQPEKEIKTTEEWNQGYKDAWNKIAGLIKKYGYRDAWQKLLDAGIVNAVGEIYNDKDIDDIKALEFLTVKSMEDFINEKLQTSPEEQGQTYEDGFATALGKLVERLYNAVNPQDDDGLDGPDGPTGGTKLKSDMKDDELEPIELPGGKKKKKKQKGGSEIPEPIINDGDNDDEDEDDGEQKSSGYGKGGRKKDDDELTDNDANKLANDLEKRGNTKTTQDIQYGGIGGTGSFQDDVMTDDDLKEAGYSGEDFDKIAGVRKSNKVNNSKANIERQIERARRVIDDSRIKSLLDKIEVESAKYKNLWRDILENFMSQRTRRAGKDLPNGRNDWINKKTIAKGEYGIHRQKQAQDPQDVNIYVDVSGSMNTQLLEIIAKSLVIFSQQWKYSGINVCPWASYSGGVHKVTDFYKKSEGEITNEILQLISKGAAQCGGGTSAKAAIDAMVEVVVQTLADPQKTKKDDIHVVITDGDFDYQNVEARMTRAIKQNIDRDDVAERAPGHTVWMIYDADESFRSEWEKEIKQGTVIFINSQVVINNG